jgi:hypothetical protein
MDSSEQIRTGGVVSPIGYSVDGCSSFVPRIEVRRDDQDAITEDPTVPVSRPIVRQERSVDATGRAIIMTDEEIRARAAEIARGLDALDDMGDEEEQRQTLDALMNAIDEEPLSARSRFRQ